MSSLPGNSSAFEAKSQYPAYEDGHPGNLEMREAYSNHLQQFPWDFYVTVSARRLRHDSMNFSQAVQHSLVKLGATRAFLAVENNFLGGIHIHALTRHAFDPQLRSQSVWKYMYKAYGRSTVDEINDAGAVSSYCAKYVLKGRYQYDYLGEPAAWLLD